MNCQVHGTCAGPVRLRADTGGFLCDRHHRLLAASDWPALIAEGKALEPKQLAFAL